MTGEDKTPQPTKNEIEARPNSWGSNLSTLYTYKGLQRITPTPTGDAGAALDSNFGLIADDIDTLTTANTALQDAISTIGDNFLPINGSSPMAGDLSLAGNVINLNDGSGSGGTTLNIDSGTIEMGSDLTGSINNLNVLNFGPAGEILLTGGALISTDTTLGLSFGSSTTEKFGFYGATPVIRQTGNLITSLSNLGLVTSGSLTEANVTNLTSDLALKAPLASPTFSGTVTTAALTVAGNLTLSAHNLVTDTTTGSQIGTGTTQKLAFYGSTPVVQQTGNLITALATLGLVTSGTITESNVTNLTSDLALKAPLASPTFTGTLTAATIVATSITSTSGSYNQPNFFNVVSGDPHWSFGAFNTGSTYYMQAQYADIGDGLRGFRVVDWGSGTAAFITSLNQTSINGDFAITDKNIVLGTTTGTKIGTSTSQKLAFFNSTPIVKPTVSGSRGSNAALASLITALANLGLVVDTSS